MQCPNCRTEEVGDWHYGTVQVFGGQSNAAPPNPNVEEPDDLSFDLVNLVSALARASSSYEYIYIYTYS